MATLTIDETTRRDLAQHIRAHSLFLPAAYVASLVCDWLEKRAMPSYSEQITSRQDIADFHAHGADVTEKEQKKMSKARLEVFEIMKDGKWRTIDQIQAAGVNAPPQSITIYLRSFREKQYGGYFVNRRKLAGTRVFQYQVEPAIF